MNVDILINQLDEHNQANILATKKFNPKEVLFIYDKNNEILMDSVKRYYENYIPNVKFNKAIINEGEIDKLIKIINENKNRNILVNLTGGSRVNSLALLNISKDNLLNSIYVDIKNKFLYTFGKSIEVIKEEYEDMQLDNLIKASGGELLNDASSLCDKEDLIYLTKKIYENLGLWHKYKQKLYDSNIFIHDYQDAKKVTIKAEFLEQEEKSILNKILNKLEEINGIDYIKDSNNEIHVNFKNEYLKSFIFKSGTWLEMATNIMISEIKEIDEVKSGVMFLWNDKSKIVRNEVDVVAVKDSVPICISCKDSDKYNEDALNELDVYSKQIGGEKVYKILVATKEPVKAAVKERAKEMGINLIIFNGNEEKFKTEIKNIVIKN
ncbi:MULTISPECIES: DUF1887 family CARF protein [unclassified Clostridium]|uniref:Card1-like endonuclease domain-containing protein n=1 Tax=unclassified Clostridium TaxID=2614128 RepID=UPI00189730FD|nr:MULTISPECIES: DUF1887 family CARF protein [unclassified Clostridium]MCR1950937.1 DUF1887 family CARF protein [Clostridium sp. DSM 100503]